MTPPERSDRDRIVLVADWHLAPERTAKTEAFVRFVDEIATGAARLFVLGDLFNAWVGPRHAACPGHAAALDALDHLARAGTPVALLRGNRDFLLDRAVGRRFGLDVPGDLWRGELAGRRVRLSHGDELTEDDRLHKTARAVFGHFPIGTLVKRMPLGASGLLAAVYRWISQHRRDRRNRNKLEPSARVLRAEFESGTDIIVIGHWHKPSLFRDALGLPGKTFVRLGECTEHGASYAELSAAGIELKQSSLV